jgi:hypothetical protein
MSPFFHRPSARLAAPLVAVSLVLALSGATSAHVADSATISIAKVGTLQASASGGWNWASDSGLANYVGFAIDWGDVTSGNELGGFHVGDGTAATNAVLYPTSPDKGLSGTWGPKTHTYAAPGIYRVCVIVYDLGQVTPFATTGYHSTIATGANRNSDNTVDRALQTNGMCATVDFPASSPSMSAGASASEIVGGATSTPLATPPSTSTGDSGSGQAGTPVLVSLLLASTVAASLVLRKRLARVRNR